MREVNISTRDLSYNKKTGILAKGEWTGGYPNVIWVTSTKTGKVVRFHQDANLAMDKEFWDGEEMWYFPEENIKGVKHLVLSLN